MSDLTRTQKARLGFFILFALALFALVVIVKVGESLFDHRDAYLVRMPGSVGALDPGSSVTFNGIVVGRVDKVAIDPLDVGYVAIDLSLAAGTPIPEDARASVAMRGITGLKYVELTGGTNATRRRVPGEEIPAGRSGLDELQDHAVAIAAKLDGLLGDLRAMMFGPSSEHIESTFASVRRITEAFEDTFVTNAPRVATLLERIDELAAESTTLIREARTTTVALRGMAETVGTTMRGAERSLAKAGVSFERVGGAVERLTSEQVEPLVKQLVGVARRAGADLGTALDEIVQSFESIAALADALRADPSSILLGRSGKERKLP